tara:strand:- start:99 stop:485 length:387 start_codon:yes stop_codon:yes gene_type:complete
MDKDSDTNIKLIKDVFEKMLLNFNTANANGVAEHIQFPALAINTPAIAFRSKEEFIDFFDAYPLPDDFSHTKPDRLDIYPIGGPIYCLDYDFKRLNHSNEILSQGRAIYFFRNDSGSWKVFSFWNGDI